MAFQNEAEERKWNTWKEEPTHKENYYLQFHEFVPACILAGNNSYKS
jgi:hypothetical protein